MNLRTRLRRILLALALGLAPLAAGCVTHEPLVSDVAYAPSAWSGPPIPLRIGIADVAGTAGDEMAPVVNEITRRSLFRVLSASRMFAGVRDLGPAAPSLTALARSQPDLDLVLRAEVEAFELYSHYYWWALYGVFLGIPFPGTGSLAFMVIILGAPVASDVGHLTIRLTAWQPATGKIVGVYRGRYDEIQQHTVYEGPGVTESLMSHPEIMFQRACDRAVQELGRDRFWVVRFQRAPTK